MRNAGVGRIYADGQIVFKQGEAGDCLFVVQDGEVEVIDETHGRETLLRIAGSNELVGEEVLVERQLRAATVRARGEARILTIKKRNLLKRMNEDPSLAFNLVEKMSQRIRQLHVEVVRLRHQLDARSPGT